jgi:hypothetical protein
MTTTHDQDQSQNPSQNDQASVIFAASDTFNPSLRGAMFSSAFILAFTALLDKHCAAGAALPRAEAAYLLGLTPKLEILTDKEEKSLRARCEKALTASLAKHGIDKALRAKYEDEIKKKGSIDKFHGFDVQFILECILECGSTVTEEQRAAFEADCEAQKFDAYADYRRLRNANLEAEGILGFVINEEVVPGYTLQKGPGGGICKDGTTRPANQKSGTSAPKPPKFPERFLEVLAIALDGQMDGDKEVWEPLLPPRRSDERMVYVKRSAITQRMSAIKFEMDKAAGITGKDLKPMWLGSEFENYISAALTHNVIPGFDSERGVGKGIFRLASGETKKPKAGAKKEETTQAPAAKTDSAPAQAPAQAKDTEAPSNLEPPANEGDPAKVGDEMTLAAHEPQASDEATEVSGSDAGDDANETQVAPVTLASTDGETSATGDDSGDEDAEPNPDAEIAAEVAAAAPEAPVASSKDAPPAPRTKTLVIGRGSRNGKRN